MNGSQKRQHPRAAGSRAAGPAFALTGAVLLALLALAARSGTGQDKTVGTVQTVKPAQEWTVESHDRTSFPLTGKHRTLSCRECHINLVFEGTPSDCEVCHWQRRQDDRYGLRLGTRCSDCHTTQSWKKVDPPKWSHETATGYRLEGIHRTLDCETCHGTGGFAPQPTDCYACHEDDYSETRDPDHREAKFPTDCAECHDQKSFENASFASAFDLDQCLWVPFSLFSGRTTTSTHTHKEEDAHVLLSMRTDGQGHGLHGAGGLRQAARGRRAPGSSALHAHGAVPGGGRGAKGRERSGGWSPFAA